MQFQHLLQQSIARSRRAGLGLALLYIDMDKFKEVNDTFGHASGDRVLEVLTERLTRVLPPEAVLGRLAGDEFALFIDGFPADSEEGREQVMQLARTVLDAACAAFHINQQEVYLSVSIGISFCPRDADNVIDVIRNADAAMYHAKQNGGNSLAVYSNEMNAAAVERLMLKSKLRRAVERNEFVVHYQPKVDLIDGRIIGAEALLRWRLPRAWRHPALAVHPDGRGEQPHRRDRRMGAGARLHRRQRAAALCGQSGPHRAEPVAEAAASRQPSSSSAADVFERHHVPPESLELEITESTLMADTARAVQLLNQLAAMGLHLSIDDFGTGYSSLSALQQFPISTLKIDQSFVRDVTDDPGDATLVRTIIDMGHGLGMEVVAEGVETLAQLHFVRDKLLQPRAGQAVRRVRAAVRLRRAPEGPERRPAGLRSPDPPRTGAGRERPEGDVTMRYSESREQSAELLRMVLPLMSRQAAGFHPLSYAVWYEYCSGYNLGLKGAIDELLAAGKTLEDEDMNQLFDQYVAMRDIEASMRMRVKIKDVIERVSDATSRAKRRGDAVHARPVRGAAAARGPAGSRSGGRTGRQPDCRRPERVRGQTETLRTNLDSTNQEVDRLREELQVAQGQAQTDPLTGLLNRRGLDGRLSAMSEAELEKCSCLFIDIDHFKKVNDTHGHLLGDRVIAVVAAVIRNCLGDKGIAARMGGEEFAAILPALSAAGVAEMAERIRANVEKGRIRRQDKDEIIGTITVSVGAATPVAGERVADMMRRADRALYKSKQDGRNRVSISTRGDN